MVFGSVERLMSPAPIHYREALIIAALGLIVNLVCAFILGGVHDHGHGHHHGHDHDHHGGHGHQHDLNLKSAYVHVLADAATSVLAILALVGGWVYGLNWLDPIMGVVGAVMVAVWAKGLIKETGKVLLDREMDHGVVDEIREVIQALGPHEGVHLTDLHVWRVGKQSYSCALTVVTHDQNLTPGLIRQALKQHEEIVHTTIEVHHQA
jgi:cation diffusion facilitator family transporter